MVLQRGADAPLRGQLALRLEPDGRLTCRLLGCSPQQLQRAVPGAEDEALLEAIMTALGGNTLGEGRGLEGGELQTDCQRTPLGEETLLGRRMRGTRVDSRAYGLGPDGVPFVNVSELEVWRDTDHGWPALVSGQQRLHARGDPAERLGIVLARRPGAKSTH